MYLFLSRGIARAKFTGYNIFVWNSICSGQKELSMDGNQKMRKWLNFILILFLFCSCFSRSEGALMVGEKSQDVFTMKQRLQELGYIGKGKLTKNVLLLRPTSLLLLRKPKSGETTKQAIVKSRPLTLF